MTDIVSSLNDHNNDNNKTPNLAGWLASSGLAVGADLTRMHMPIVFFLNKTILEMLNQNEMRRIDLLLQATNPATPIERFKAMLAYYFSCCFLEEFGKKPLYSITGETIRSKYVNFDESVTHFMAEQVSSNPPTTAAVIWNKSCGVHSTSTLAISEKFWGTSIYGVPEGLRTIRLLKHGEAYTTNPPQLAVRLLRGSMEYVGESILECVNTKLKARINFKAKPLVGGQWHEVDGDITDTSTNTKLYTISGNWSDKIWIQPVGSNRQEYVHEYWEGPLKFTTPPLEDQQPLETGRLWRLVHESLNRGDFHSATEARREVEVQGEALLADGLWKPQHFNQGTNGMYYHKTILPHLDSLPS